MDLRKHLAIAATVVAAASLPADPLPKPVSAGIGFAMTIPDLAMGGLFSFYNVLDAVGFDFSALGSTEKIDKATTEHVVSLGLGLNVEVPWVAGLYPSIGVVATLHKRQTTRFERATMKCPIHHGETHCPVGPVVENDNEWSAGLEAKLTYVVLDWVGITAGYRAPFSDLLGGSALVGVSVVMSPAQGHFSN